MDFLAPILFPNGEKTVESFVITGISLGGTSFLNNSRREKYLIMDVGHVTWKLLHDGEYL